MKALTIWQPWAWCIAEGHKSIENRVWPLPPAMLRTRVAIHAGLSYEPVADVIRTCTGVQVPPAHRIALGAIVATAMVVRCVTASDSPWFVGPYGFVFDDVRKLVGPVRCRGRQKFWTVPSHILEQIAQQGGLP